MPRQDVLDAALRTLNQTPSASMATIAQHAGISRATLNRHFASRDALLRELGERSLDRWETSIDASGAEDVVAGGSDLDALRAALDRLLRRYLVDAESFGFALTETRLEQFDDLSDRAAEIERREQAIYAAAQQAGVLRQDVTPQWISWSVFGLLVGTRDGLRFNDLARRGLDDIVVSTFFGGCGS